MSKLCANAAIRLRKIADNTAYITRDSTMIMKYLL